MGKCSHIYADKWRCTRRSGHKGDCYLEPIRNQPKPAIPLPIKEEPLVEPKPLKPKADKRPLADAAEVERRAEELYQARVAREKKKEGHTYHFDSWTVPVMERNGEWVTLRDSEGRRIPLEDPRAVFLSTVTIKVFRPTDRGRGPAALAASEDPLFFAAGAGCAAEPLVTAGVAAPAAGQRCSTP